MKWRWKHFSPKELQCKGTGKDLPLNSYSIDALDRLEEMRNIVGKPFVINSAYRSPEHNRKVGGAKNSLHVQGRAFDIRIAGHNPKELYRAAKRAGFNGIGFHTSFLHVDNRTVPAEWEYGKNKARHLFVDGDSHVITNDAPETEDTLLIEQQADGYIADNTTGKQKAAIAAGGIAGGAGVIELVHDAAPLISGLSLLDWRVGVIIVAVLAIGGVIWWKRKSS
jgi:hypothetical protein